MEYGTLVKSKTGFITLSFIGSISYWLIFMWWNNVVKKYQPLIIGAIFFFLLMFPLLIGLNRKYTITQIKKSFQQIPYSEYGKIIIMIIGLIIYSYLLLIKTFEYHSVATIRLVEFVTTVFVNMAMIYFFYNDKINARLIIGMIFTAIGGYLVITGNNQ